MVWSVCEPPSTTSISVHFAPLEMRDTCDFGPAAAQAQEFDMHAQWSIFSEISRVAMDILQQCSKYLIVSSKALFNAIIVA